MKGNLRNPRESLGTKTPNALNVETGNNMKSPASRILTGCAHPLFASLLLSGTVLSPILTLSLIHI